jgi:RNA polymerase-binding protein DksA
MTQRQQKRFMKILEDKREEILHDMRSPLERLEIDSGGDEIEQACGIAERDLDADALVRMSDLFASVEEAIELIHEGEFGVCVLCGCDIPEKRMEVVPWARLCVSCQRFAEQSGNEAHVVGRVTPAQMAAL